MSDEKKQGDENWRDATPDDVFKVLQGETVRARVREEANQNWVSTDVDGYDLHITGWHRDKFIDSEGSHWTQCQVYCEPAPTRIPKDGCRMLEDNEEPMPGDFINWGAGWNELTAAMFPLALIPSWYCRPIKEPISKPDRLVPKGFRLLGDEPRLASDGYWSLSCKDWLVIGDRIEIANRDWWPAIRFVVDEPKPAGGWEPTDEEFQYAKDLCRVPVDPIQAETGFIMQIRLPVPASVLGKLGDMLEKHYPGSTMRQVGGFLVFDEPIES